jgi:hypothetical protein
MSVKKSREKKRWLSGRGMLMAILLFMSLVPGRGMAEQATVRIDAPESVSGTFDVAVTIDNVADMDAGQFDFRFDPEVINVTDVKAGSIGGTTVPLAQWAPVNEEKIRVLFNFPGVQGVSGSGELARITAKVAGKTGDISMLEISEGLLVDSKAKRIPADWQGGELKVETSAPASTPASESPAGQTTRTEADTGGIAISTPMAVTVLLVLVAIPILVLLMYRRKRPIR